MSLFRRLKAALIGGKTEGLRFLLFQRVLDQIIYPPPPFPKVIKRQTLPDPNPSECIITFFSSLIINEIDSFNNKSVYNNNL